MRQMASEYMYFSDNVHVEAVFFRIDNKAVIVLTYYFI